MRFPFFRRIDFDAFAPTKREDEGFNGERKVVWGKMSTAKELIDPMLGSLGERLGSRVSNYWPCAYNHFSVGSIWIRYSSRPKEYYNYPHLIFEIRRNGFFFGMMVNPRARRFMNKVSSILDDEPELITAVYSRLQKHYRVVEYGDNSWSGDLAEGDLTEISRKIRESQFWLGIGERFSRERYSRFPQELPFSAVAALRKMAPLLDILSGRRTAMPHADSDLWREGGEYSESPHPVTVEGGIYQRSQRHRRLSRLFRQWIRANYSVRIRKETRGIDVEFMLGSNRVCVELKTSSEGSSRTLLRGALGQLFEYNYFPSRSTADQWMIVLDTRPTPRDIQFVGKLCEVLPKPLTLGWLMGESFKFYPEWPQT